MRKPRDSNSSHGQRSRGRTVAPSNENLGGTAPPPRFGPEVRHKLFIRTMCEAFNKTPFTKPLLGGVHKLLRLYLTLPVESATSKGTVFLPSVDSRTK